MSKTTCYWCRGSPFPANSGTAALLQRKLAVCYSAPSTDFIIGSETTSASRSNAMRSIGCAAKDRADRRRCYCSSSVASVRRISPTGLPCQRRAFPHIQHEQLFRLSALGSPTRQHRPLQFRIARQVATRAPQGDADTSGGRGFARCSRIASSSWLMFP
jgi:hypothetical protein